jgi:hypothetical protein
MGQRLADVIEKYMQENNLTAGRNSKAHAEALERIIQDQFVVLPQKLGGKQ